MDNAAGQRVNDICVLLSGVKNKYGYSMTPNKLLWGYLFNLYEGPNPKQRSMIIIERIRDIRPDLIGTLEDDKLLREFDNTTLATMQESGRLACSDYAAPAIIQTTTGGSQGFVRKEHVTVWFARLCPKGTRYSTVYG